MFEFHSAAQRRHCAGTAQAYVACLHVVASTQPQVCAVYEAHTCTRPQTHQHKHKPLTATQTRTATLQLRSYVTATPWLHTVLAAAFAYSVCRYVTTTLQLHTVPAAAFACSVSSYVTVTYSYCCSVCVQRLRLRYSYVTHSSCCSVQSCQARNARSVVCPDLRHVTCAQYCCLVHNNCLICNNCCY